MDASEPNWFSDFETEDCNLFRQCQLEIEDDEELLSLEIASALENFPPPQHQQPFSSESHTSYSETSNLVRPAKQLKTNLSSWNSSPITDKHFSPNISSSTSSSPTSQIMLPVENTQLHGIVSAVLSPQQNKGVSVSPPETRKRSSENPNYETKSPKSQGSFKTSGHGGDHIIAERKRREKLSQSLIALAALIPGLKKMDKASVLGDAIRYVKELQERQKTLEENKNRDDVGSVVMVNKARLSYRDGCGRASLPRVEARVSEKDVLLRIHCQKQKGLLLKILVEIQNLHLFVVNSSVLSFGDSIIDITIVAQMGTDYKLTINELVKNLRRATLKSMS
ncbi:hypothetical protein PHAVU_002G007400 [Phaseolus vulgaris]|uniref:BHLH domain-containing protein n=1 Tax=Phaseolus vulgaris TaxID=3885 RepID=V7CIG1_PHAVU|nr:hypothetical protein PHAVU_002G007400g [Phaseolus vulgaris]ESW28666.1 hypothetical protein PHAVU_002G007400g [Phaseolus vulgaris]